MNIEVTESQNESLDISQLNSYLTQIVLSISDDEVKKKKNEYLEQKRDLVRVKKELSQRKKQISEIQRSYSREKAIYRLVKIISALQKEGVLTTNWKLRNQLLDVIPKFQKLTLDSLVSLQEKLYVHLPDKKFNI